MPRRIATNPLSVVQGPANPACRTIIVTSTIDSSWLIPSSSSPTCWHRPSPRSPGTDGVDPVVRRATAPTPRPTARCALAKAARPQPARRRRRRGRRRRPRRRGARVEVAGPGLHQPHLRRRLPRGTSSTGVAADERLGVPRTRRRSGRRRLLGAQRRQGDARRPPAHDGDRRRPRAHARVRSATTVIRENHVGDWGTPVRHADRAPARPRRGRRRRRARRRRPRRLLQAGERQVRRRARVPATGRASASCSCRAATPRRSRSGSGSSTSVNQLLQRRVRQARRAADRRRPRRREHVPRRCCPEVVDRLDDGRAAARQRRRRGRVPARASPTATASRCR